MIKAIFFDVDGTLLSFTTHSVPASTISAFNQLRTAGIKVFVATGRHASELDPIKKAYDFDGYLTLNGQYCFDSNDNLIHKLAFDRQDVQAAVHEAKRNLYPIHFVHEAGQFINMVDGSIRHICETMDLIIPPVVNPEIALDMDIYQLSVYLKKEDEASILDKLKSIDKARWHEDFIDIIPAGGGKHEGIRKTLDYYNIPMEEAMAFGDGENDITMLTAVGIGVAMGNAGEPVKLAADYVTSHIDDDGVEKALKYFSLIK